MHKSRIVLVSLALVLMLALLIPLVGCGGGGTSSTATATKTQPPPSGSTLTNLLGGGKNLGDVKFDMVYSSPPMTSHVYYKNYGLQDQLKARTETSMIAGTTTIYLVDSSTQTAYMWMKEQNIAYKIDIQTLAQSNPTAGSDQVYPTKVGTETVDGHDCDIYQYTYKGATTKIWIWKEKHFQVKMETTTSVTTTTIEYKNIVFGTLDDSLFQLPATVTVTTSPS